jgi:hypothetical protein
MVLYNATSAVVVVLTSSSNSTRFVMEYEGIARQPDWMRKSPWIAFWIAIGVVFLAVWSCVALYILCAAIQALLAPRANRISPGWHSPPRSTLRTQTPTLPKTALL